MKMIISFILIFSCSFNIEIATAQEKIKEGKATFTFSYPNKEEVSEQSHSSLEQKACTVYFKDGKTRVEYESKDYLYLIFQKEQVSYLLKRTNAFKHTFKGNHENEVLYYGDNEAKVTNETKMIAGFKCVKAEYKYMAGDNPRTIEIWFIKEIEASNNQFNFKGIDGFIMEYSWIVYPGQEGVDLHETMTCTGVEKVAVTDELLKIPSDMEVINWEDFKNGAKVEYH